MALSDSGNDKLGHPVRIVDFKTNPNQNSKLALDKKLLKVILAPLKDIPIHVLSIAGASRQGKSFLLSVLINILSLYEEGDPDAWKTIENRNKIKEAFEFKNGVDRLTVGFWMWPKPFILTKSDGSKIAILIIDTQGVFDPYTNMKDWSMIVGLALITSTTIIYNLQSNMQEDTLSVLSSFIEFGMLSLENNSKTPFQKIIFLIRDWNIPQSHPFGVIGGTQFLENKLQVHGGMPKQSVAVRERIRACFEETECFLLPHPGIKGIQNDFAGQVDVLDSDFVRELQNFTEDLLTADNLKEKKFGGDKTTAEGLMKLFEKYVDAFNSVKLPDPKTLFQVAQEAKLDNFEREIMAKVDQLLAENISADEVEIAAIKKTFEKLHAFAKQEFEKMTTGINLEREKKYALTRLTNQISGRYEDIEGEMSKRKNAFQSAAIGQASQTFSSILSDSVKDCPLLPEQFGEATKYAENYATAQLSAICQAKGQNYFEDFLPTFKAELLSIQNQISEDNFSKLEKEEKECASLVSSLNSEYANFLNMGKFGKGKFTRDSLRIVHNQALEIVLQKLKQQLKTSNSQLYENTEAALKSEINSLLEKEALLVKANEETLSAEAEGIVQRVLKGYLSSMELFQQQPNAMGRLAEQHLLQKALNIGQLTSLYNRIPERAQHYIDEAVLEMDRHFEGIQRTISENKIALKKQTEDQIKICAKKFEDELNTALSKISDFGSQFQSIKQQLKASAINSKVNLNFTDDPDLHNLFVQQVTEHVDCFAKAVIENNQTQVEAETRNLLDDIDKEKKRHEDILTDSVGQHKIRNVSEFEKLHKQIAKVVVEKIEKCSYRHIPLNDRERISIDCTNKMDKTFQFWKSRLESSLKKKETEIKNIEAQVFQEFQKEVAHDLENYSSTTDAVNKFYRRATRDALKDFENDLPTTLQKPEKDAFIKALDSKLAAEFARQQSELGREQQKMEQEIETCRAKWRQQFVVAVEKAMQGIENKFELDGLIEKEIFSHLEAFEAELRTTNPQLTYIKLADQKHQLREEMRSENTNMSREFKNVTYSNEKAVNNLIETYLRKFKDKYTETIGNGQNAFVYEIDELNQLLNQIQSEVVEKALNSSEIKKVNKDKLVHRLLARLENERIGPVDNNNKRRQANAELQRKEFESYLSQLENELNKLTDESGVNKCIEKYNKKASDYLQNFKTSNMIKSEALATFKKRASGKGDEWKTSTLHGPELELKMLQSKDIYHEEMKYLTSKEKSIHPKILEEYHRNAVKKVKETLKLKNTPAQMSKFEETLKLAFRQYQDINDMNLAELADIAIGIDLGTTYSCAAVYFKGEIQMIPDRVSQKLITPSYVLIKEGGEIVVGQVAKEEAVLYPGRAIFDAKRLIGRKFNEEDVTRDIKLWPFQVIDHKNRPKIRVGADTYFPEQISAEILKKLKLDAESYLKCEIKNAVITVPAYFSDSQKMATKDAGMVAGLNVLSIINEPTAAAIAYSLSYTDDKERHVLVYDLGGGTFDVSVLKIKQGDIQVLAVGGNNHLGGEDFDNKLLDYCLLKFTEASKINLREGQKDIVNGRLRRIRHMCEQKKIILSETTETKIIAENISGEHDLNVEITRDKFNELNQTGFDETITVVKKTLGEAKLTPEQIDDIVLVGGSSKIPKIQEMLKSLFYNKPLNMSLNVDEVVGRGAAIYAAIQSGNTARGLGQIKFSDVAPLSIGIKTIGNVFSRIINKNTKVPAKDTKPYYTAADNQTEVEIAVYEGEDSVASNNNLLGKFTVKGIPPAPYGKEEIKVTIDVNKEGILTVSAVIKSTGSSKDVRIDSERTNLTEEEKERLC